MVPIGVISDSHGNLDALDQAYRLLCARGAQRFFFAGGRYQDIDEWLARRRDELLRERHYSNQDFLDDVVGYLAAQPQVPRPPAFGQTAAEYEEAERIARLRSRIVRAPEKECGSYQDPNIPRKPLDLLGDSLCCIVHDRNDLDREDLLNASIFVYGKQPKPGVVQIGPRYFVTPGQLADATTATCGLLEQVEAKTFKYSAFTLAGETMVDGQVLSLGSKSKVSVK